MKDQKTESLSWINNRLKNFGFYPEFKYIRKYKNELKMYLGNSNAIRFLKKIDSLFQEHSILDEINTEEKICDLIGADEKLLKMVYSTGIHISVVILNRIMDLIEDLSLNPEHIVDFGGANGWSLQIIKEFLEDEVKLSLIEQNKTWGVVEDSIILSAETYSLATLTEKADFGISIFGSTNNDYDQFSECVYRNLTNDGIFILTLRIPDDETFMEFMNIMNENGFYLDTKNSEYFCFNTGYNFECFPLLVFRRNQTAEIKIESLKQLKRNELK